MLDKSKIGYTSSPFVVEVEKGAIRRFADAIGDPNPLYRDEDVARSSPFGAIVAPPTFIQAIIQDVNASVRKALDYDPKKLLHGEQSYTYYQPVLAGDVITCIARIADIYEKEGKSGTMDFFVVETTGTNQRGKRVFVARSILVVRREVR